MQQQKKNHKEPSQHITNALISWRNLDIKQYRSVSISQYRTFVLHKQCLHTYDNVALKNYSCIYLYIH